MDNQNDKLLSKKVVEKIFLELLDEVNWLVDRNHYGDWDIYYDNDYDAIVDRYKAEWKKITDE